MAAWIIWIKATLLMIALLAMAAAGVRPILAQAGASNTETSAVPAATATTASQAQTSAPASMDPNDVRALLYKIYTTAYRVNDLASTLQPGNLKISDQDRAALQQQLDNLRAALVALEKPRAEFYNNPASGTLGQQTLSALKALLPQLQDFETTLAQSAGAAQASDYQQPAADLELLTKQLEPYVSYLGPKSAAPESAPSEAAQAPVTPASAGAAPNEPAQTPPAPPPATTGAAPSSATPLPQTSPVSMDPNDVRALLYKIYTSAYRVTDLASTLQLGNLKISDQDRAALQQKLDNLRAALAALEKPRGEFYNHPDSAAVGRETLSAMKALLTQIQGFETALAESAGAAEAILDYQQPAADLAGLANRLEPYVSYLEGKSPSTASAPSQTAQTPAAASAVPGGTSQTATAQAPATAGTASSVPQTSAPAPSVSMDPNDVRALLYKIYTTAYRVTDLASTFQPSSLKISDQDRSMLGQKLDALRAALIALEKPRGDFYNHPESETLGRETIVALKTLLPQLDDFQTALAKSADAAQAKEYQQPAADLAALASQLEPYVNYLEASAAPPAAGRAGGSEMKTVEIQAPTAFIPITSTSTVKPPLDPNELKQLLYKAYVPAFRIKDLLGQEHPERWQASEAERGAFNSARQALDQKLAEFDTWRAQFVQNPQSLEDAFQTYRALWSVLPPLEAVSRSVGQSVNAQAGAEYRDRGQEMAEVRDKLEPYISYLLKYHDQTVQMAQRNLVACENQLGYAMRPRTEVAVPMKNIIPVFQGERVREREAASKSHSTSDTPKKARSKRKSTQAASSPVH